MVIPLLLRRYVLCCAMFAVPPCMAGNIAPFQVVSSNLSPFTVEDSTEAPGALGRITQELSVRLGHPAQIRFYPWARAVAMAQYQPRTAILPLTRTPERETQYRWLVKLYRQNFVFITRSNPDFDVNSLDVLRQKRIVLLRSSPNLRQLQLRNFRNVLEVNSVADMARMLRRNMVDAVYGGEMIGIRTLQANGFRPDELLVGMTLDAGDIWLAGSRDFTEADSAAWQEAMDGLVRDGTYRRILRQYRLPE